MKWKKYSQKNTEAIFGPIDFQYIHIFFILLLLQNFKKFVFQRLKNTNENVLYYSPFTYFIWKILKDNFYRI